MIVSALQHDIVWEDPASTHDLVHPLIAAAAGNGADLVVLTEMFATGFTSDPASFAQSADGPSVEFLSGHAQRHGITLMASIPWRLDDGTGFTNRLLVVDPSGVVGHYDKIHPFTYGGESEHYRSGSEILTLAVGRPGVTLRVTPQVCYDLRFAPGMWRAAPETDCFVIVANWPSSRRHHWRSLLMARAIENQAYVVGVNRVGSGGGLDYVGDSMIVDPLGEVLADGEGRGTAILTALVATEVVADVRRAFPFLQDRTP